MKQICPVCQRTNISEDSLTCPQCDVDLESFALLRQLRHVALANHDIITTYQEKEEQFIDQRAQLVAEVDLHLTRATRLRQLFWGSLILSVLLLFMALVYVILDINHLNSENDLLVRRYESRISTLRKELKDSQILFRRVQSEIGELQKEQRNMNCYIFFRGAQMTNGQE